MVAAAIALAGVAVPASAGANVEKSVNLKAVEQTLHIQQAPAATAADTPAPPGAAHDTAAPPPPPPVVPPPPVTVKDILTRAAQKAGIDPNLLMAVSWHESSWRQSAVSDQGAIGLLQVMPLTAASAGPMLLGRQVNIQDPLDNAAMGAALLKDLLSKYDERTALAAYYQGEPALFGGYAAPDTWNYADSIEALKAQIVAGQMPADPNQPPG